MQSVLMRPHDPSPSMGVGNGGSGVASGGTCPGVQQHTFAVILNMF